MGNLNSYPFCHFAGYSGTATMHHELLDHDFLGTLLEVEEKTALEKEVTWMKPVVLENQRIASLKPLAFYPTYYLLQ